MKFLTSFTILFVLCSVIYALPVPQTDSGEGVGSSQSGETPRKVRQTSSSEDSTSDEKDDRPPSNPETAPKTGPIKRDTESSDSEAAVHQLRDYLKSDTNREVTHTPPAAASQPFVSGQHKRDTTSNTGTASSSAEAKPPQPKTQHKRGANEENPPAVLNQGQTTSSTTPANPDKSKTS